MKVDDKSHHHGSPSDKYKQQQYVSPTPVPSVMYNIGVMGPISMFIWMILTLC